MTTTPTTGTRPNDDDRQPELDRREIRFTEYGLQRWVE